MSANDKRRKASRLAALAASKASTRQLVKIDTSLTSSAEPVLTKFMERWFVWADDRRKERGPQLTTERALVPDMLPTTAPRADRRRRLRLRAQLIPKAEPHVTYPKPQPRKRFAMTLKVLCGDGVWRERAVTLRYRDNLWGARNAPPVHSYRLDKEQVMIRETKVTPSETPDAPPSESTP